MDEESLQKNRPRDKTKTIKINTAGDVKSEGRGQVVGLAV